MPGELKDLRAADRAGGEDRLAPRLDVLLFVAAIELHAEHAAAFEPQLLHERAGDHGQVGPLHRGPQERFRRAPAHAVALVHIETPDAFVVAAIEVLDLRNAGFGRGIRKRFEDLPSQFDALDAQLAALPVLLVRAAPVVFGLHEDRQHVLPRPAGVAGQLRPLVVVARLAAQIEHRVDRGAAAEHAPARIADRAAVQPRLGLGLVAPVGALVADAVEIADGDVDPHPVVFAAGFQQQNRVARIGREAVGEDAAGGAGADDDVVEPPGGLRPPFPPQFLTPGPPLMNRKPPRNSTQQTKKRKPPPHFPPSRTPTTTPLSC